MISAGANVDASPEREAWRSAAMPRTRPLLWSVRRELWENRSVTIAPMVAGAVVLLGFLIGAPHLPRDMRAVVSLDPSQQGAVIARPYQFAALVMIATELLVGFVYCLGGLHSERRDRSILFWKSLPVSDRTTVLGKAIIPLGVLPLITVAAIASLQAIMLTLGSAILLADGVSAAPLWTELPLLRTDLALLYGLATLTLWHAPIMLWLLLVSGLARRAAFLWAVLPPLALGVIEFIAFRTTTIFEWLGRRLGGSFEAAFDLRHGLGRAGPPLDPAKFAGTPGLWIGLAMAAGFLVASIRLRRRRDPI